MRTVKIFEMLLRDGLQSINKTYPLAIKLKCLNELVKNNYWCIEYGSTTSPKLLPQMENSFEIGEYIENNIVSDTKFTMLITNKKILEKKNNIKSFGLVCSASDYFANNNLKKSAIESLDEIINQLDIIVKNNKNSHIRIYISCSFGDSKNLNLISDNLQKYVNIYYQYAINNNINYDNFDIVLCDTIGCVNKDIMNNILDKVNNENLSNYLGLHLHSDAYFEELIDVGLKNNIYKYDSSLLGIGGCPFSKSKNVGNIPTTQLIKYLHSIGYITNIDVNKLIKTENIIADLLIGIETS